MSRTWCIEEYKEVMAKFRQVSRIWQEIRRGQNVAETIEVVSTSPKITGREVESFASGSVTAQATMRQESGLGWPSLQLSDS
ncbi:hypothetical protein ACLB2K_055820 [Fragaria x ananassa]